MERVRSQEQQNGASVAPSSEELCMSAERQNAVLGFRPTERNDFGKQGDHRKGQGEQNGIHFSSVAPSREELRVCKEFD